MPPKKSTAAANAEAAGAKVKVIVTNRRARHEYEILESYECGVALVGAEVKSLREGNVQLKDSFARIDQGEAWLYGVHISPWVYATGLGGVSNPERHRKLLMHRKEIDHLMGRAKQESLTLVPLSIYFKDGRAKVEIGLARGKKTYDKRQAIAARDNEREQAREFRGRQRG